MIRLEDGDQLVGAVELTDPEADLAFITSDAQLLHFPASSVRPQGRSGAGMAGIKLAPEARVIWFGAVRHPDTDEVVTVSGSSSSLPGTEAGMAKVTPLCEYPGKGRATGGVRAHRFLKGEDTLLIAAIGPAPVVAAARQRLPGGSADRPRSPRRLWAPLCPSRSPCSPDACHRSPDRQAGPVVQSLFDEE